MEDNENKFKDLKPKYWYNTQYSNLVIKKKPFEKFKKDIENNSRIFFATSKNIDHDAVIVEKVNKAENIQTSKKSKKKKIFNF